MSRAILNAFEKIHTPEGTFWVTHIDDEGVNLASDFNIQSRAKYGEDIQLCEGTVNFKRKRQALGAQLPPQIAISPSGKVRILLDYMYIKPEQVSESSAREVHLALQNLLLKDTPITQDDVREFENFIKSNFQLAQYHWDIIHNVRSTVKPDTNISNRIGNALYIARKWHEGRYEHTQQSDHVPALNRG